MNNLLHKVVLKFNVKSESEIPGKLREHLKLIPHFRLKHKAHKLTVGSISKYFEDLILTKKSKFDRVVRKGKIVRLNELFKEILSNKI